MEKVHEERMKNEKKMNELTAKLYQNFAIEKAHATDVARKDEQDQAAKENDELRRFVPVFFNGKILGQC